MSDTTAGKNRVFLVMHSYERPDGAEEIKTIGVFSTLALAQSAVDQSRLFAGFKDHPDGFSVDPYLLDQQYWDEGFETM